MKAVGFGSAVLHRELREWREAEVRKRLKRLRDDLQGLETLEWCFEGKSESPFEPKQWGRASRCGTIERTRARIERLRLEVVALEGMLRRGIRVEVARAVHADHPDQADGRRAAR